MYLLRMIFWNCFPLSLDDDEKYAGGNAQHYGEHGHDGRQHDVMEHRQGNHPMATSAYKETFFDIKYFLFPRGTLSFQWILI